MELGNFKRYKSWTISASIVVAITLWLVSGQFGSDAAETEAVEVPAAAANNSAVRVRTQSAEEVMRTIIVNGKTAPARVVNLAAETDGRVEYIGAERGASLNRGQLIVRLDERDRSARLAQAEATVKQREVEYQGRQVPGEHQPELVEAGEPPEAVADDFSLQLAEVKAAVSYEWQQAA